MATFNIGDVVYLKSGILPMTVVSAYSDPTDNTKTRYITNWVNAQMQILSADLPPEAITTTKPSVSIV
jgi:uncharacterized protein YodC (DUF2158 family)